MSKRHLPRITIVTPSFNQGKFIERTIESVLGQNYPQLEYIVVDGDSTDETLDILKRYGDRLQWISEKDSGQSEAINKGFLMAKGEIVAWLNSDDVYLPGALETVARYFAAHPDVMMIYGEGYMIDQDDKVKMRFPFTEPRFDLWKLIYYGDYILQQSTFFRRSLFDSIELLDEALHYGMDWDLFIRIGKRFRVDYIPEYLGCIREHGEAKTSTGGSKRFRELKCIIRKHGILRFPLSYFHYAWDAYGKPWFENGGGASQSPTGRLNVLNFLRSILSYLFSTYAKRCEQGYYSDGWISRKGMVLLQEPAPQKKKSHLVLEGEAFAPNVPFRVRVVVNRKIRKSFAIRHLGAFQLKLDFPPSFGCQDSFHVEIGSSRSFSPRRLTGSADERRLAFIVKRISIEG